MTEPSWLLATMAQSAAAVVAIVGGFLVSRVVALSSERQGLERRVRELEQQIRDRARRLQKARSRRQAVSWEQFVSRAGEKCAERYEEQGSVSPEWLVDECWLQGVPTREEMLDLARRLIQTTQQASEFYERGGGRIDRSATDPQVYEIYRFVSNARAERSRAAKEQAAREQPLRDFLLDVPAVDLMMGGPTESDEMFVWKQTRYDKLIEAEREQQDRLSLLGRERDFVRTEAARVARPQGLWLAAWSFAYLTVVGVVVPVVGLAWRPVPSDLLSRRVLVFLFVTGLFALGWYLIWAIRQLTRH